MESLNPHTFVHKKIVSKAFVFFRVVCLLLTIVSAFGFVAHSFRTAYATPPSSTALNTWFADEQINSIFGINGKLYLVGYFGFWGPNKGNAYPVSKSTGEPLSGYPSTIIPNTARIISDGSGGWYVAGEIKENTSQQFGIIHVLSNGSVDTSFNAQSNQDTIIYDMALSGGVLYVSGWFGGSIGGQSRTALAALDPVTGNATAWVPGGGAFNGHVKAIEIVGDTMYIGGTFTTINGTTRNRAAAIEISTGNLLAWDPNVTGFPWKVNDIKANGSVVYIGGEFNAINSTTRGNLGAVDATTGALLSWNPDLSTGGYVDDMYFDGSNLYVAGWYTQVGATVRHGLSKFDTTVPSAPTLTSWDPSGSATVQVKQMYSDGTDLYVVGYFISTIGGQSRRYAAAINQSTGLANSWNPRVTTTMRAIGGDSSTIYLGNSGYPVGAGGLKTSDGIVEFDPTTGAATDIFNLDSGSFSGVDDVVVDGTTLYIGGDFTNATINGVSRSYFAAIDMNTGQFTSWNPQASRRVRSIKVTDDYIYVGGEFAANLGGIGGDSNMWYLARFHKNTGLIDSTWVPDMYDYVYSIAVSADGSTIYAAGKFNQIGATNRSKIAAISATTGLPTSWNPNATGVGFNCYPDNVILSSTTLYVSGCFGGIGGATRNYIAALDTTTDTNNATSFNPNPNGSITDMSLASDGTLYMSGYFSTVNGQSRDSVAAWNTNTDTLESWQTTLGQNSYVGSADYDVYSIYGYGGAVFMGGDFHTLGGNFVTLANYNSVTFQPYFAQFGTFTPPVSQPEIQFSTTTSSDNEASTTPSIIISLSATYGSDVTVTYTATGGTATGSGTDYTLTSGTATITAGNTATTVPLTIINDSDVESDETVIITLSSPSNATLGSNTTHTYTITNDDVASTPGGGGGGSGGNGPIVGSINANPKNSIKINKGATTTPTSLVTLTITSVPEVTHLVLSNKPDFVSAKKETVVKEKPWNLCDVKECPPGLYRVYAKFLDKDGGVTEVVSTETAVQATSTASTTVVAVVPPPVVVLPPPLPIVKTPPPPPKPQPQPIPEQSVSSGSTNQVQPSPISTSTPVVASVEEVPTPVSENVEPVLGTENNIDTNIIENDIARAGALGFFIAPVVQFASSTMATIEQIKETVDGRVPGLEEKMNKINKISGYAVVPVVTAVTYALPVQEKLIRVSSAKDMWIVLTQAVQSLLAFLGLRKKRKYWGTVYDSKNKQPIDPAIVQLIDAHSGEVVEEAVTDMAGRYGFLSRTGTFYITAEKTHYEFPSKNVTGSSDAVFENVYHGEVFSVTDVSSTVVPNIPMDPVAFDWNQLDKKRIVKMHPKLEHVFSLVSKVLFWGGLAASIIVYMFYPTLANLGIVILYGVVFVISVLLAQLRLWGQVLTLSGGVVAGALIELVSPQFDTVVLGKALSAPDGKFFLKANAGNYTLKVKRSDSVGEMKEVDSMMVKVNDLGVVNKNIYI